MVEEPEQQISDDKMPADSSSSKVDADILVRERTADSAFTATSGESHRDSPDARIRFAEKRRLDWRGQTCPFLF